MSSPASTNSHESSTSTFDPRESSTSTFDPHESPTSTTPDPYSKTSDVLQTSAMPPVNRSGGRDVHIYDAKNPTAVLGGLILSNRVTNANLYSMLGIFIVFEEPFPPQGQEPFQLFLMTDKMATRIEKNDNPLQPRKYHIVTMSRFLHHPFMIK